MGGAIGFCIFGLAYGPGLGILGGVGRSGGTRRGKRSLISTFACFLTA